ncbi:MAG: cupin domain-containing protein [Elusimicrobiota bacterium]
MSSIRVEKLSREELDDRGVFHWPVWEKEKSKFDWHYDEQEQCFILKGKVKVKTENGDIVEFKKGDFVTFPKGLSCEWEIFKGVRKHYKWG